MIDRGPNKLVTELAEAQKQDDSSLETGVDDAVKAAEAAAQAANEQGKNKDEVIEAYAVVKADAVAKAYTRYPADRLVTLEGYLGATVKENAVDWRVVYRDATCSTWVLIGEDAIVRHREGSEPSKEPPFESVDFLWLRADTPVLTGREALRSDEIKARSLRGEFVPAGDVAAGGTFSGLFGPPGGGGRPTRPHPRP
jgi:hypothetical protein